ncbi:DUF6000 family protein [Herbidospora cretacea]|uniref:DUF6000 family protein n=1 Tax=Herbidospora cretacea TaxID=28444 RepID=UPI000B172341|nr:DUF6000 family protein [Herbidospora cretacea]
MRVPLSPDHEMMKLARRYVVARRVEFPRYMNLMGNFLGLSDRKVIRFGRALAKDARRISDHDLSVLLDGEWRARLTAAWLIGLDRRVQFRERLSTMLLDSELVYAGAGYCLALARFGEDEDAAILSSYLDRYLPQVENRYDEKLATDHAGRFLTPNGLWETFSPDDPDASDCKRAMAEQVSFAESAMNGTLAGWTAGRDWA